jgi:N-acetylmuramoyl-L-alanine amidase
MLGNQRIRRGFWRSAFPALSLLWLLALAAGPAVGAVSVVHDLRVGDHGSKTRFVLELGDRVDFKAFALADPYRLVVDLPEVGWTLPARPLPADIGLLASLRYGLVRPGQSRIVLDLKAPATIQAAFLIEPQAGQPYRLVVDLVPSTREAVLAAASASADAGTDLPSPGGPATPDTAASAPVAISMSPAAPVQPLVAAAPEAAALVLPFALPPPKPILARRSWVVAIDAGHGGIDPGAIGASGSYEKHITLAMARELAEELEKSGRYKAVLIRDRDVFIRLRDRTAMARAAGADLFVSLHADAIDDSRIRGLSVYTLSEKASDKEAEMLAERENKADLIAGVNLAGETPEVTNILIDLAQRETMNESARFAGRLVKNLPSETRTLRNSHRFAGFAVLKSADIPSVLVELGFMSNPQDEKALKTKTYRSHLVRSLVQSIDDYFLGTEQAGLR